MSNVHFVQIREKKERGKLTKWKMKIFSLENGRKKNELILAPHRVHEKYSHIIVTIRAFKKKKKIIIRTVKVLVSGR